MFSWKGICAKGILAAGAAVLAQNSYAQGVLDAKPSSLSYNEKFVAGGKFDFDKPVDTRMNSPRFLNTERTLLSNLFLPSTPSDTEIQSVSFGSLDGMISTLPVNAIKFDGRQSFPDYGIQPILTGNSAFVTSYINETISYSFSGAAPTVPELPAFVFWASGAAALAAYQLRRRKVESWE